MVKPLIIGITGRKGSGKDTAALVLTTHFGAERQAFADPLKNICRIVFGLTVEELTDRTLKEAYLDRWPYQSPREILQKVGTECFRAHYPEVWVEAFRVISTNILASGKHVVVPDLRFMNEALHIRSRGGVIVKIDADERLGPSTDGHASETEMEGIIPDFTIPNNSSEDKFLRLCSQAFRTLLQKDIIK